MGLGFATVPLLSVYVVFSVDDDGPHVVPGTHV
jgi:hypothetical protein